MTELCDCSIDNIILAQSRKTQVFFLGGRRGSRPPFLCQGKQDYSVTCITTLNYHTIVSNGKQVFYLPKTALQSINHLKGFDGPIYMHKNVSTDPDNICLKFGVKNMRDDLDWLTKRD